MNAPISRKQAYAKLVVLMGDYGLPAPERMAVGDETAGITLATADAFEAWTAALNAENTQPAGPFIARDGWRVYGSHVEDWHGRPVSIGAQVPPAAPEAEPVTEDMTRVREIAGAVSE